MKHPAPYIINGRNGHNGNGHGPKSTKAPDPKSTKAPDQKLQPHNIDAEEAVIGSLLIDTDSIVHVSTILKAQDFFIDRYGWIYEAILSLYNRQQPADMVTVADELERHSRLDDLGGHAELTRLLNVTPTSIHAVYYAGIVKRLSKRRRLIDAAGKIAQLAYQDHEEVEDDFDQAESILFGVTGESTANSGLRPMSSALERVNERIEFLSTHKTAVTGIPTGLIDLDRLLGGLQRSDMVVLAGRPGMGKTSLGLSIALQAARKWQKRVGIFSLEMSDEQLTQRLISAETRIDSQKLKFGKLEQNDWPVYFRAIESLRTTPIYIDDTPALSINQLRSKARRMYAETGLDLLIVDYLQLMDGGRKSENRQQEVSDISRGVKALARELNIPILALSQLSRAVEARQNKRPILSDLRESGSIEQDADIVMFIYLDEAYNPETEFPNVAEIIVSKHRSGPTGVFSVYFKKHLAQFVDLEVRTRLLDPLEPLPGDFNQGPHVSVKQL